MRIGYLLKRFPRASETFIAQEILGLERHGVEVAVFALRPNDERVEHSWLSEIEAPIEVYEPQGFSKVWQALQKRARSDDSFRQSARAALLAAFDHPTRSGKGYLEEAHWLDQRCQELEVDHIHAHFANHPTFVAMLTHLLSERSYSFTAHAKDIYLDGPPLDLWRRQVAEAAFAITVCQGNWRHLESLLGPDLISKVEILYNGVDVDRIVPKARVENARQLTVLSAGRLVEKKGVNVLVEAAPEILRRHPAVRFVIAGDGDQRAELQRRVGELSLENEFHFVGGLPHQEIIDLMSQSDVFVLPCRVAAGGDRDALPTVLLEAMAAGLACVSTTVNGVPEIIADGHSGLIVPEGDAEALVDAVSRVLQDPMLRHRMGQVGRQIVEQKFDLAMSTAKLRSLFEATCGSQRPQVDRAAPTAMASIWKS